jgi:hypothetical protein
LPVTLMHWRCSFPSSGIAQSMALLRKFDDDSN